MRKNILFPILVLILISSIIAQPLPPPPLPESESGNVPPPEAELPITESQQSGGSGGGGSSSRGISAPNTKDPVLSTPLIETPQSLPQTQQPLTLSPPEEKAPILQESPFEEQPVTALQHFKIYYGIGLLVLIFFVGMFMMRQKIDGVPRAVIQDIRQSLKQGVSKQQAQEIMKKTGYSDEEIEKVFRQLK